MSKEIISESRLREIISEEAIRFKKKLTLEAEKKKLLSRLNEMYTEECGDDELEEGLGRMLGLTDSPEKVEARKKALVDRVEKLKTMGYKKFVADKTSVDEAGFMKSMSDNGYSGRIISEPKSASIIYQLGKYGASRLGTGGASQGLGV